MKQALYIFSLIFICSCATPMKPERVKTELEKIKMPLLIGEPTCKYEVISALSEKRYDEKWGNYFSVEQATLNLKKKAQVMGADAVINFKNDNAKRGDGVSGIAIKCIDGKML